MRFFEKMVNSGIETDKQNPEVSGRNGIYFLLSGAKDAIVSIFWY
jgi:hypothetical protein